MVPECADIPETLEGEKKRLSSSDKDVPTSVSASLLSWRGVGRKEEGTEEMWRGRFPSSSISRTCLG